MPVGIRPGARTAELIKHRRGLAQDGKTNAKAMPNLLQVALLSLEYADVLAFSRPPLIVQKALFGVLAPIARMRGYRGSYPEYLARHGGRVDVEPWSGPGAAQPALAAAVRA